MNELLFPEIRAGEPVPCGGLAVFPLYPERSLFPEDTVDYLLSDEAIGQGLAPFGRCPRRGRGTGRSPRTSATSPSCSSRARAEGAKQNRAVASSVLVAAESRTRMPVCCVQRGGGRTRRGSSAPARTARRACDTC